MRRAIDSTYGITYYKLFTTHGEVCRCNLSRADAPTKFSSVYTSCDFVSTTRPCYFSLCVSNTRFSPCNTSLQHVPATRPYNMSPYVMAPLGLSFSEAEQEFCWLRPHSAPEPIHHLLLVVFSFKDLNHNDVRKHLTSIARRAFAYVKCKRNNIFIALKH